MKQIIITVLAVVGIIGGAIVLGGNDEQTAGAVSNNFYGPENGVITVTEYGDFECPACSGFAPIVNQVKENFKDQVRFEFRHFPLVQIHGNATAAHRAAQAAANQGKFWEMHDLLYERQQSWRSNNANGTSSNNPTAIFEGYAEELGLDIEKFKADARASETLGTINADTELGKSVGVASTPTFLIDGKQIEDLNSASTVEGFTKLIQDALDAKAGENPENSNEEAPADSESPSEEAKPEE